jgi:hypothetical protein
MVDEIPARTWGVANDAHLDTAEKKFGTASLYLDGTDDYITADSALLNDEDFTIEMWFYPQRYHTTDGWGFYLYSQYHFGESGFAGRFLFGMPESIAPSVQKLIAFHPTMGVIGSTTTVTLNEWHHAAVTRSGSTVRIFLDGNLEATGNISTGTLQGTRSRIGTAIYSGVPQGNVQGWIDDIRITRGVARYTANFTPPSAPFPNPI